MSLPAAASQSGYSVPSDLHSILGPVRTYWTRARILFEGGYCTVVDQGVVSAGNFLVNVLVARSLTPHQYGVFALFYSGVLVLLAVNISVIFYPLSVRGAVGGRERLPVLLGQVLAILLVMLPLGAGVIALATAVLGTFDLALPAILFYVLWQGQESLRRWFFAGLRHRDAIWGDTITYLGQAAVVAVIAAAGTLSVHTALYAMAAASAAGIFVQIWQVEISLAGLADMRRVLRDFWQIGKWALINNLISIFRLQTLPWMLTAFYGPAAAAVLQAANNLVAIVNPLIIGLGNIIPQTAARSRADGGNVRAWQAIRGYVLLGAVPLVAYYTFAFGCPEVLLTLLYGGASYSLDAGSVLRLLAVASTISYLADMICSYFHGIDESVLALIVNAVGSVATLCAIPLISRHGVVGACIAVMVANIVRALLSRYFLNRTTGDGVAYVAK
jgi:O-antigen/teichoic acid export membrane protein